MGSVCEHARSDDKALGLVIVSFATAVDNSNRRWMLRMLPSSSLLHCLDLGKKGYCSSLIRWLGALRGPFARLAMSTAGAVREELAALGSNGVSSRDGSQKARKLCDPLQERGRRYNLQQRERH